MLAWSLSSLQTGKNTHVKFRFFITQTVTSACFKRLTCSNPAVTVDQAAVNKSELLHFLSGVKIKVCFSERKVHLKGGNYVKISVFLLKCLEQLVQDRARQSGIFSSYTHTHTHQLLGTHQQTLDGVG